MPQGPFDALTAGLAEAIDPSCSIEQCRGQDGLDGEDRLVEKARASGAPQIRMWQNHRCLVTTRTLSKLPHFRPASGYSKARGWPVIVRGTGGLSVVHRPGILNVSLATCHGQTMPQVGRGYLRLIEMIGKGLERLGLGSQGDIWSVGEVAGSYCDGKYNLTLQGRKLAGTAAQIRCVDGRFVMLSHASITVAGSVKCDVNAVMKFERELKRPCNYRIASHTSLESALVGL